MRLEDKHFIFPDSEQAEKVIARIKAVLSAPAVQNKDVFLDERLDLYNSIYYESLDAWVNPIWPLISLQRERSLLGQKGDEKDFDFANGYVGRHAPGTENTSWNGLGTQIKLGLRTASWTMGKRPSICFRRGSIEGKLPDWERWSGANKIALLRNKPPYDVVAQHVCGSMAEYVQLRFTPSETWEELLDTNGAIYEKWIKPFWEV